MPRPHLVYQKGARHRFVVQDVGGRDRCLLGLSQTQEKGDYQGAWLVTGPEIVFIRRGRLTTECRRSW